MLLLGMLLSRVTEVTPAVEVNSSTAIASRSECCSFKGCCKYEPASPVKCTNGTVGYGDKSACESVKVSTATHENGQCSDGTAIANTDAETACTNKDCSTDGKCIDSTTGSEVNPNIDDEDACIAKNYRLVDDAFTPKECTGQYYWVAPVTKKCTITTPRTCNPSVPSGVTAPLFSPTIDAANPAATDADCAQRTGYQWQEAGLPSCGGVEQAAGFTEDDCKEKTDCCSVTHAGSLMVPHKCSKLSDPIPSPVVTTDVTAADTNDCATAKCYKWFTEIAATCTDPISKTALTAPTDGWTAVKCQAITGCADWEYSYCADANYNILLTDTTGEQNGAKKACEDLCGCGVWTDSICTYKEQYPGNSGSTRTITEHGLTKEQCDAKSCKTTFVATQCAPVGIGGSGTTQTGLTKEQCSKQDHKCYHSPGTCSKEENTATNAVSCAQLANYCTFADKQHVGGECLGLTAIDTTTKATDATTAEACANKVGGCHWTAEVDAKSGRCGIKDTEKDHQNETVVEADIVKKTSGYTYTGPADGVIVPASKNVCLYTPVKENIKCQWAPLSSICSNGRLDLSNEGACTELCNTWTNAHCDLKSGASSGTTVPSVLEDPDLSTTDSTTASSDKAKCEIVDTCTYVKATCSGRNGGSANTDTATAWSADDGPTKGQCLTLDVSDSVDFEEAQCTAEYVESTCGDGSKGLSKADCAKKTCFTYTPKSCTDSSKTSKAACLKSSSTCTKKFYAASGTCARGGNVPATAVATKTACEAADCPDTPAPTCTEEDAEGYGQAGTCSKGSHTNAAACGQQAGCYSKVAEACTGYGKTGDTSTKAKCVTSGADSKCKEDPDTYVYRPAYCSWDLSLTTRETCENAKKPAVWYPAVPRKCEVHKTGSGHVVQALVVGSSIECDVCPANGDRIVDTEPAQDAHCSDGKSTTKAECESSMGAAGYSWQAATCKLDSVNLFTTTTATDYRPAGEGMSYDDNKQASTYADCRAIVVKKQCTWTDAECKSVALDDTEDVPGSGTCSDLKGGCKFTYGANDPPTTCNKAATSVSCPPPPVVSDAGPFPQDTDKKLCEEGIMGCGEWTDSICAVPEGGGFTRSPTGATAAECAAVKGCWEWIDTAKDKCTPAKKGCKNSVTGEFRSSITTPQACIDMTGGCAFKDTQCVLGTTTKTGLTEVQCKAEVGACTFTPAVTTPFAAASCPSGTTSLSRTDGLYCMKDVAAKCIKVDRTLHTSYSTQTLCEAGKGCATYQAPTCTLKSNAAGGGLYIVGAHTFSAASTAVKGAEGTAGTCLDQKCGTWTFTAAACTNAPGVTGTVTEQDKCEDSTGGKCSNGDHVTKTACDGANECWTPGVWTAATCTSSLGMFAFKSDFSSLGSTDQSACEALKDVYCAEWTAAKCAKKGSTSSDTGDGSAEQTQTFKTTCDDHAASCSWAGKTQVSSSEPPDVMGHIKPSHCSDFPGTWMTTTKDKVVTGKMHPVTQAARKTRDEDHPVSASYNSCADGSKNYGEAEKDCGGKRIKTGDTTTGTGAACDACPTTAPSSSSDKKKDDAESSTGAVRASWASMLGSVLAVAFALLQ